MSTIKSSAENLTLNADGANNDIKFQSNGSEVASIDQAGNIALSGTVDGVDVAAAGTLASAALPKAGGTMTGDLTLSAGDVGIANNQAFRSGGQALLARYDPVIEIGSGDGQDYLKFKAGGDERMRISTAGVVSVPVGIELGSGVDGTAANTLDDYEEGTWTPTDNSGAGLTYSVNAALYTKIGNLVHISTYIDIPTNSSTAGVKVGGLPFTSGSSTSYYPSILSTNSSASDAGALMRVEANSNNASGHGNSNNTSGCSNAQLSAKLCIFQITYTAA